MNNKLAVVFDLDDTLIYEEDFLFSAYFEIANCINPKNALDCYNEMVNWWRNGENVFANIMERNNKITIEYLLFLYRNHYPQIVVHKDVFNILNYCKMKNFNLGVITDGRKTTQLNKLKSTDLIGYFDRIVISEEFGSEKPSLRNFSVFHELKCNHYFYIGDNPKKDFKAPNFLGWTTICLLDSGKNIHKQSFDLPIEYLPSYKIGNIYEVKDYIDKVI